jgi:hypothetical protein
MAAVASMAAPSVPIRTSHWIIGREVDLSLVIGSAVAGYAFLLLCTAFHVPINYLWWVWSVGFDGTHIFATASRTFFDKEARAHNPKLLYGSLLFFFTIGPVMVLLGAVKYLAILVGVWAYYHVIRQHYGFMVLYKVKYRDLRPLDNSLDRVFLGVMLVFPPFHRFFVHHPEELGLHTAFSAMEPFLWAIVGATLVIYLGRQFQRWRSGDPVNVQKYLLFAAIMPLHWLTFAYVSWQAAVPTVTIVHNLQYHAIVWFHNRNRYTAGAEASHGRIPTAVSRSLLVYVAVGLAFSLLYRIPGFALGKVSELAFGFFCGFGLTHYYLDSRIWRVRHDPGLRAALRM